MFEVSGTSQPVTFSPPSFWFWVKAGMGLAVGVMLVTVPGWLMLLWTFAGVLATLGSLFGGKLH